MGVIKDISGNRYGKLVAVKRIERKYKDRKSRWICKCDCGKETVVAIDKLQSGITKSCGCLKKEASIRNITQYNLNNAKCRPTEDEIIQRKRRKRLYDCYRHMMERCVNPNVDNYKNYGERGIEVCEEWENSFENFYTWALSNGYKDNLTIDRIDVNGNYEPSNCRWATNKEQQNNRRNTIIIWKDGEKYTISDIAKATNIGMNTLWWLYKNGWLPEEMFLKLYERRKENEN